MDLNNQTPIGTYPIAGDGTVYVNIKPQIERQLDRMESVLQSVENLVVSMNAFVRGTMIDVAIIREHIEYMSKEI